MSDSILVLFGPCHLETVGNSLKPKSVVVTWVGWKLDSSLSGWSRFMVLLRSHLASARYVVGSRLTGRRADRLPFATAR